ncbi:MAG: Hsp33 family molecular chaperone HslO [Gammaproteobacteria bacterium]
MNETDTLRRFLFEGLHARGELVHLDETWRQIQASHDYPPAIRAILGEALAASVLLASTIKFDGVMTMQIQGDGPMHLLVVECSSEQKVRGLAKWKGEAPSGSFSELAGAGRLAITVERGEGKDRYQGIVPLSGDSLSDCLDAYFAGSVQLPTRLWLAASDARVAGMLIQRLPMPPEEEQAEDDDWNRLQLVGGTVTEAEMIGLAGPDLLRRLFAEDDLRLFRAKPVVFSCSCSRERVAAALRMMGREDIDLLIEEQGEVEAHCEFCNRQYLFDPVDAEGLFAETSISAAPDTLH